MVKDFDKGIVKTDPSRKVGKATMRVIIFTERHRVEGRVHAIPGSRLIDFLNAPAEFIPLTDAVIFNLDDEKELGRQPFVAVRKHSINLLVEAGQPGL